MRSETFVPRRCELQQKPAQCNTRTFVVCHTSKFSLSRGNGTRIFCIIAILKLSWTALARTMSGLSKATCVRRLFFVQMISLWVGRSEPSNTSQDDWTAQHLIAPKTSWYTSLYKPTKTKDTLDLKSTLKSIC